MSELKPCPFCGVTLRINNSNLGVHPKESDCLFRQQVIVVDSPSQVAAWNTRAVLAQEAGKVEAVAYRYKEGHASWENEKPWEPTTLAHGAVLIERKALAANGTFKGDSQAYYLALTVEPLYTSPPAPVSVMLEPYLIADAVRTALDRQACPNAWMVIAYEAIVDKIKDQQPPCP
jgi:hypothetical protein